MEVNPGIKNCFGYYPTFLLQWITEWILSSISGLEVNYDQEGRSPRRASRAKGAGKKEGPRSHPK
jgi:hypothetical protein